MIFTRILRVNKDSEWSISTPFGGGDNQLSFNSQLFRLKSTVKQKIIGFLFYCGVCYRFTCYRSLVGGRVRSRKRSIDSSKRKGFISFEKTGLCFLEDGGADLSIPASTSIKYLCIYAANGTIILTFDFKEDQWPWSPRLGPLIFRDHLLIVSRKGKILEGKNGKLLYT
ncbi:hypothetical protein NPIL_469541 [Nephila pilipes]|uniref:Uncharacterized protein n=1 Tax=Nephila pilipes TaxID=299642 RepID=A0A8X6NGX7_NEPPI|nr:hypothetical protein NPIL_469541 [Nephila pilipes]